jgi:hypothetical protein
MHVQRNGVQLMKAMTAGVDEGGARDLEDVAKRFKRWRESRVRGERIPAALWGQAVQMCQQHTPQRVAGVLRVALTGLMRRLERGGDRTANQPGLATEFVEVLMPTAFVAEADCAASRLQIAPVAKRARPSATLKPVNECVVEFENVHGTKMRLQLNGAGLASLGPLLSTFWCAT